MMTLILLRQFVTLRFHVSENLVEWVKDHKDYFHTYLLPIPLTLNNTLICSWHLMYSIQGALSYAAWINFSE